MTVPSESRKPYQGPVRAVIFDSLETHFPFYRPRPFDFPRSLARTLAVLDSGWIQLAGMPAARWNSRVDGRQADRSLPGKNLGPCQPHG